MQGGIKAPEFYTVSVDNFVGKILKCEAKPAAIGSKGFW